MKKKICSILGIVLALFIISVSANCENNQKYTYAVMYCDAEDNNTIKPYDHFGRSIEDYLPRTAYDYSPELAELLMAFSYSAYSNAACYESYQNFGFEDIHFYSHDADISRGEEYIDSLIGFGIGRKKVSDSQDIVMITVRGTTGDINLTTLLGLVEFENTEWQSDAYYNADSRGWHSGFANSADAIYAMVKDYITNHSIDRDHLSLVVTGHSRGAAGANLLSVLLTNNLYPDIGTSVDQGKIYDYNFACPDTVRISIFDEDRNRYENIFNINMAGDIVSYVPGVLGDILPVHKLFDATRNAIKNMDLSYLSMLNDTWTKYGRSYWFASDWLDASETGLAASVHHQKNYLNHLNAHIPIDNSRYKSYWDSRAIVYASTPFNLLAEKLPSLIVSKFTGEDLIDLSVFSRYPIEGLWTFTSDNGSQKAVYFEDGKTNLFDQNISDTSVLEDSYFIYSSASQYFLIEIHTLTEGTVQYIVDATNDTNLVLLSENNAAIGTLSRVTSSGSAGKARPISNERSIVLVMDTSGSMSGTPIRETIKAAGTFIGDMAASDVNIGIVDFDSSATRVSDFGASISAMSESIVRLDAGGGTNISEGLSAAVDMLNTTDAKKNIIILMSDGEPESGLTGDDLFAYADELKDSGIIIYTLGFFSEMGDGKATAQQIMERIASPGYHYEIDSTDDLRFLFEDVADQLSGQHFIFVRIECPVDVAVSYNGETLSSTASDKNLRTSFGTLSFEESTEEEPVNDGADRRTKVLRLKEGVDYPIQITGTGQGTMNYSIGLMDRSGEYTDFRRFEGIPITNTTVIDTVANVDRSTVLRADNDSDGRYDVTYVNTPNGKARRISASTLRYVFIGIIAVLLIVSIYGKSDEIVVKKPSMRGKDSLE